MPVSYAEGKQWTIDRIMEVNPDTVVDIGPGVGTYGLLLVRAGYPGWMHALEIWQPYIEEYNLHEVYHEVYLGDIRDVVAHSRSPEGKILIIFGDVLEHMTKDEALKVLEIAKRDLDFIVVSIPIVHMPQGSVNGNPYEEHVHHWTFSEMHDAMDNCEAFEGDVLGVFFWDKESDSK